MSQTKFSLFITTMDVDKTRAIPWTDRNTRRFAAFFFPRDEESFLPPSTTAAVLGAHVVEWRARARKAGWNVDKWDHVQEAAA